MMECRCQPRLPEAPVILRPGSGQARHIFYLHGFASSAQSKKAAYFAERLQPYGATLHCPDFNEPDFASLTMTRMLEQVEREIAGLPKGAIALIGSSLGGVVAIHAAGRLRDRIDRLVLLAPALMFGKDDHRFLGPERVARWRATGTLDVFHYAHGDRAAAGLRFLRGQPEVRRLRRRHPPADADFPGPAGRIGRLPGRGAVRRDAAERHPVAARRRPSADREPAADLGRHGAVSGADRLRAAIAIGALVAALADAAPPYVIVDLRTNRVVASSQPGSLDAPIAPGSVMKIATLVAALESGAITPKTAILCKRDVAIDGRRLPCSHPGSAPAAHAGGSARALVQLLLRDGGVAPPARCVRSRAGDARTSACGGRRLASARSARPRWREGDAASAARCSGAARARAVRAEAEARDARHGARGVARCGNLRHRGRAGGGGRRGAGENRHGAGDRRRLSRAGGRGRAASRPRLRHRARLAPGGAGVDAAALAAPLLRDVLRSRRVAASLRRTSGQAAGRESA